MYSFIWSKLPGPTVVKLLIALVLFAAVVAWSRLHLQRHVPRDLVAGVCTGLLAGLAFLHFTGRLG